MRLADGVAPPRLATSPRRKPSRTSLQWKLLGIFVWKRAERTMSGSVWLTILWFLPLPRVRTTLAKLALRLDSLNVGQDDKRGQ